MVEQLSLRVTFVNPPPGVAFCLRRGKDELIPPTLQTDTLLAFDLSVDLKGARPDGSPNLLGPLTHRRPNGRILVVNVGTLAGQMDSCWTRAVLIPLAGIDWEMIQATRAAKGAILEARMPGRTRGGGPACATLRLLGGTWQVTTRDQTG